LASRWPLLYCALFAALAAGCSGQGHTRDVIIVARGMSFIIDGQESAPNPLITFQPGERIRIQLRNEAPGLLHDFVIPAWGVEIEQLRAGESRDLVTTVPATPGRFKYHCRPHSEMMTGFVEVAP
jgi:plastocyanin